jgi:hypothetical protein
MSIISRHGIAVRMGRGFSTEPALPRRFAHDLSPAEITAMRQSLGALPLIVLTASAHIIPRISKHQQIAIENLWKTMHGELAALSSEGLDRPVPCWTHFIQLGCPSVVIGAMDEMISRVHSTRSPQLEPLRGTDSQAMRSVILTPSER